MKPECKLRKNLLYRSARFNGQKAITVSRLRITPAISAYNYASIRFTVQMINQLKEILCNFKCFLDVYKRQIIDFFITAVPPCVLLHYNG